jgi:hypothetical protein
MLPDDRLRQTDPSDLRTAQLEPHSEPQPAAGSAESALGDLARGFLPIAARRTRSWALSRLRLGTSTVESRKVLEASP